MNIGSDFLFTNEERGTERFTSCPRVIPWNKAFFFTHIPVLVFVKPRKKFAHWLTILRGHPGWDSDERNIILSFSSTISSKTAASRVIFLTVKF